MPLIGGERTESINGYVLVHPVSIGVRESEWLATDRAGACVLEIWERFDDSTQAGLDLDGFVDRFALQRRAASADDRVGGKGTGGGSVAGTSLRSTRSRRCRTVRMRCVILTR